MKKIQLLVMLILSLFLIGSVSAWVGLLNLDPEDQFKTTDQTPKFCLTPRTNESGFTSMTLYTYVNTKAIPSGTQSSVSNNTEACVTVNFSMNYTDVQWYLNVTNNGGEPQTNMSATRTITISRLGTVNQLLDEMSAIFSPITLMIVAVFSIMIVIIIVGFVSGFFGNLVDGIRKGL